MARFFTYLKYRYFNYLYIYYHKISITYYYPYIIRFNITRLRIFMEIQSFMNTIKYRYTFTKNLSIMKMKCTLHWKIRAFTNIFCSHRI